MGLVVWRVKKGYLNFKKIFLRNHKCKYKISKFCLLDEIYKTYVFFAVQSSLTMFDVEFTFGFLIGFDEHHRGQTSQHQACCVLVVPGEPIIDRFTRSRWHFLSSCTSANIRENLHEFRLKRRLHCANGRNWIWRNVSKRSCCNRFLKFSGSFLIVSKKIFVSNKNFICLKEKLFFSLLKCLTALAMVNYNVIEIIQNKITVHNGFQD